jgi:integrase
MTGHVRQRSPGSFELRYRVGGKTATETFRGGKRDADRRLRELLSLVDNNRHPNDPDRLTVGQWLRRWLDTVKPEISPRSWSQYECGVRVHIAPAIGHIMLGKLTVADVQTFYSELAATTLKGSSQRQLALLLTNALNRAAEMRLIPTSPAEPLRKRLPKLEKAQRMVILDADQSQALMTAARETPLYTPVLIALATGMRRSEILALTWGKIDFTEGSVLVDESIETAAGTIRRKETKNGHSRIVTLPAPVIDELRRLKVEQAENLFRLGIRQSPETSICIRTDGTVSTPTALTEAFRQLIRRTGLPVCRFHDLRHSHATELLRLGVSVKVVADRLGHADAGLTLRVYAHATKAMHDEAADRLRDLFGKL